MARGDAYSRWVLFAKTVLPLIALAILSTLFLLSREIDPEAAIPYADVDVEKIAREQRLTNARYATVTEDGASIEMSAAEARPNPDNADRIDAVSVAARIELPDGPRINLVAGGALIDLSIQTAGLEQDVELTSSDGYRVLADRILSRMDIVLLTSDGPVRVNTPYGDLTAGNMTLSDRGQGQGEYRLVFNNKVKLVYVPQE